MESPDSAVWNLHGGGIFTTNSAWYALKQHQPPNPWAKVVWFPHNVPVGRLLGGLPSGIGYPKYPKVKHKSCQDALGYPKKNEVT